MCRHLICLVLAAGILVLGNPAVLADDTVSELGCSTQGFAVYFEEAALVGKVVDYQAESGKCVIYGRLSTCEGYDGVWRVFQTGRFYEAIPVSCDLKQILPACRGCGVKLFGSLETGLEGRSLLLAENMLPYDPGDDIQAGALPAWKEGNEPRQDWIGFGIQTGVYTARLCDFDATTDLLKWLFPMKHVLEEYPGRTAPARLQMMDPGICRRLRQAYPLVRVDYLLPPGAVLNEAIKAVGGCCWVRAMKGANNSYIQEIPALRPDLDALMDVIEAIPASNGFSEWAAPALFYGQVVPCYRESTSSEEGGRLIYDHACFNGVYFASAQPGRFVDLLQSRALETGCSLEGDLNRENWRLEGLNETEALSLQEQGYAWIAGQRCLEYWYTPPDGKECFLVTIGEGSRKGEPEFDLNDFYIIADHHEWQDDHQLSAMSREELNGVLNILRDMSLRGGF